MQTEVNEKALDSLLHIGTTRKISDTQLQLALAEKRLSEAGGVGISWRQQG